MTKDSAVLYCLEDAAMYLGVSELEIKRFWQKGEIRCCQKLSTPEIGAFVLRDSIESYISELYFDSVKNGDSLPNIPRMSISSSDAIQTDDLGYLSYQTVNEWGYETGNTFLDRDTYKARVFESFDGTRFSVYEIEQDGENEWSIQPQEPLAFSFSLSNDGLLKEALFSVEELDRVKLHLSASKESTTATPASLVKERTSAAKKQWKTPSDFFADEDNSTWRPEEGREAWWQVEQIGNETDDKKYFYRALLLYFRYRPEAPDPSIDTLLVFMRAYKPNPKDDDPLWNLKELEGKKQFSLDGSENYQPYGNRKRPMLSILKTRKISKQ